MIKRIYLFALIILSILLIYITIFNFPKKFISRLIFSHDLSLLTHSVFNNINNEINFDMTKKKNQKKSLIVLNNYVYDFFGEIFDNIDDGVSWKMLHGSTRCDGFADIFLRLTENINTRVAMIFLYNADGVSTHTLNYVDLDNSINNFNDHSQLNKMYLFDPTYNLFPVNKNSEYVNIDYMMKNRNEFLHYEKIDLNNFKLNFLQENRKVFMINRTYDEYSIINKLSFKLVKIFPKNILKFIFKFGIYINPELEIDYKKFLYARLEHILLNYEEAKIKYSKITDKNIYHDNAQFWYKRILSSEAKLKKYEDILSHLISSKFTKNLK
tara:strand:+ start:3101 stop:4078 length:978 start_codon:yes stop_codon:yes gene_type:complete